LLERGSNEQTRPGEEEEEVFGTKVGGRNGGGGTGGQGEGGAVTLINDQARALTSTSTPIEREE